MILFFGQTTRCNFFIKLEVLIILDYQFISERLGFRNWHDADLSKMALINADVEVMEYFQNTQSLEQTQDFMTRMNNQFIDNGYCYFAVDRLETKEFIGFIGVSHQSYEADFTPCIDIGWRLDKKYWGNGFATEGAKRVLSYAFDELKLDKILSIAPVVNLASESVMKKIGMQKVKTFEHALLKNNKRLKECVLYEINNSM